MVTAIKNGDIETGLKMQLSCVELTKSLFCEVNPIPIKEAMNMMGMNVGSCRLPLVDMSDAHKELLRSSLVAFGLL